MNNLIDEFLEAQEDKSENTLLSLKLHITELSNHFDKLLEVTGPQLKSYFREMRQMAKPATINAKMSSARAFYKWLRINNRIFEDPTQYDLENVPNSKVNDLKHLTVDEVGYVLLAARGNVRDYAIIRFMLDTACRVGEVVNITIPQFNLALKEKKIRILGKGRHGGKIRYVAFNSPKTIKAIKNYLDTRDDESNILFISKFKDKMHERSVQKIVKKYMHLANAKWHGKCKIDASIMYPHVFRHTAVTEFYKKSRDIMATKDFAGHDSINTTVRYVHLVGLLEQGKTQQQLPWNSL